MVFGELVQKVSGMPLDQYAQTYIFGPLGMTVDALYIRRRRGCRASRPPNATSKPD